MITLLVIETLCVFGMIHLIAKEWANFYDELTSYSKEGDNK